MKSIYLFFLGVYAEFYKQHFDRLMDKYIKNGNDISSPRLTKMSNNSYNLYVKFREYEKNLKYDINLRKIIKNS